MTWLHPAVRNLGLLEAFRDIQGLASWSDWEAFQTALPFAPREPGVYLLRELGTGHIRYVGMAGERAGSGRLRGCTGGSDVYRAGKGAVSGLGEAALGRALADADWLEKPFLALRTHGPRRAKEWARDAVARLAPEVSSAVRADASDAQYLEGQVELCLRPHGLWNR